MSVMSWDAAREQGNVDFHFTEEARRNGPADSDRGDSSRSDWVPSVLDGNSRTPQPSHLSLSPEKRIFLYDDAQWEEFVLEWATTLDYAQVMRNGGANDHGVDMAGFATAAGFGPVPMSCNTLPESGVSPVAIANASDLIVLISERD